ncbi:MAG: Protein of unknown function DUF664, partial [uncultured Nocardioides sp.]
GVRAPARRAAPVAGVPALLPRAAHHRRPGPSGRAAAHRARAERVDAAGAAQPRAAHGAAVVRVGLPRRAGRRPVGRLEHARAVDLGRVRRDAPGGAVDRRRRRHGRAARRAAASTGRADLRDPGRARARRGGGGGWPVRRRPGDAGVDLLPRAAGVRPPRGSSRHRRRDRRPV